jgi:beta-galactosidase
MDDISRKPNDSLIMKARHRKSFDIGWRFLKGDISDADKLDFSDEAWRTLNLPHDWSVEGPFDKNNPAGGDGGYLPAGIGWYRKCFYVSEDYKEKNIYIELDGVYMNSDVWINGNHLGKHLNGYTGFHFNLTPFLNFGEENILAVKVDNSEQPGSRWYTGSGIYRHTWLIFTDKLYIAPGGTYITTPQISKQSATVVIRTKINNEHAVQKDFVLTTTIIDRENKVAGVQKNIFNIAGNSVHEFLQAIYLERPNLWSLNDPYIYNAVSGIECDEEEIDEFETTFGIRKILFDSDKGFYLNDESIKLNGVCLHHDGGCVGAAVPERVLERRFELLKEMGCNAIRTSHNPPSPEMLDMCDRIGFLVMGEAFDEWTICKEKNYNKGQDGDARFGYYKYFEDYGIDDLKDMLRRDRNHPCIVLWSVGNEIPDLMYPKGAETLSKLVGVCHEEDPTRSVTCANVYYKHEPLGTPPEFLELIDVVGFNYADRWRSSSETYYSDDKRLFPHWKMVGSENASISSIRGEYPFIARKYGLKSDTYNTNMIYAEQLWKFTKIYDYVAGDFMWTGIDYLGESRWPEKSVSFGVIDMCGFPKDAFYFYQSQWTQKPMLHIFPHWNWKGREGEVIPVLCYTNCDSVELFLNGKSFGIKSYQFPRPGMMETYERLNKPYIPVTTADLHLSWDVPYEPGVIKVFGKKDGEDVCIKEVLTTGEPSKIQITTDRNTITANGRDVCHIRVEILDDRGNVVPDADNPVTFHIEGVGALIGVDNGKPDSHENFKADCRKAFNGLCLAIVQSAFTPGQILIMASSPGLASDSIKITVENI